MVERIRRAYNISRNKAERHGEGSLEVNKEAKDREMGVNWG